MTFNYIETFIAFVDGLLLSGVGAISAALSGWMQTLMPAVLGGGRVPSFALDASHTVPIGQFQEIDGTP